MAWSQLNCLHPIVAKFEWPTIESDANSSVMTRPMNHAHPSLKVKGSEVFFSMVQCIENDMITHQQMETRPILF